MTSTPNSDADGDLTRLCRQVRAGARTIVIVALIFLVAAIVWTSIRGPVYEATAYAEVAAPADIATIEQKLRFPTLYKKAAGSEEDARDLAQRTQVKTVRNSRLIAVTVRDADPVQAAASADAIIEGFIGLDPEKETAATLMARIQAINELSDGRSMASPEVLLEALRVHKDGIAESAKEGDKATTELALKKQQLIEARIEEYLKVRRPQLGLPALEKNDGFDPEAALETTIAELGELYAKRGELDARARELEASSSSEGGPDSVRLVERAMPPIRPVAPGVLIVCLGAIVLGGFCGALLVLLRTS